MIMCVQGDERLVMEEGQMVNLTTSLKNKSSSNNLVSIKQKQDRLS